MNGWIDEWTNGGLDGWTSGYFVYGDVFISHTHTELHASESII